MKRDERKVWKEIGERRDNEKKKTEKTSKEKV